MRVLLGSSVPGSAVTEKMSEASLRTLSFPWVCEAELEQAASPTTEVAATVTILRERLCIGDLLPRAPGTNGGGRRLFPPGSQPSRPRGRQTSSSLDKL